MSFLLQRMECTSHSLTHSLTCLLTNVLVCLTMPWFVMKWNLVYKSKTQNFVGWCRIETINSTESNVHSFMYHMTTDRLISYAYYNGSYFMLTLFCVSSAQDLSGTRHDRRGRRSTGVIPVQGQRRELAEAQVRVLQGEARIYRASWSRF